MAIVIALACSTIAVLWALWQLRLTATAVRVEPGAMARVLAAGGSPDRLERAMRAERDTWEAELVSQVIRTSSADEARAEANAALLDVDGRLAPSTRVYAACARIAVFGCLIGVALLFMDGQGLTMKVLDVFAIGSAGVLVTLTAAREARRVVKRERGRVDEWVEALLRARWASASWDQD